MDAGDKDEAMDKDVAKRLILDAKSPIEQLTEITRIVHKVGRDVFPQYLNDWRQEGSFDFLKCLLSIEDGALSRDVFFRIFDVERKYLDVCCRHPVETVVEVSEKYYRIAGSDLSSSMALDKLETYLCRNSDDIDDAISHYRKHYPQGVGLSFVWLAALKCTGRLYWKKWLTWVDEAKDDEELVLALHVLTLYPVDLDASFIEDDVAERIVICRARCQGDGAKGELYKAAVNWCKIAKGSSKTRLNGIVKELVHEGCASVLYYASQNLYWEVEHQSENDVEWWLSELLKTEAEYKVILKSISLYLQKVITKYPARAFVFIEEYCIKHQCNITVFEDLFQNLAECEQSLRNRYFTKWLMSDSIALARNVYEVASHLHPENRLDIRADFGLLKNPTEEDFLLSFLRAIGWLYLMPETCVSFLVPCAQFMSVESLKSAYTDFFYLVVINYLDVYKAALNKVPRAEQAKDGFKYLKQLATLADKWWKRLDEKGECPELFPSMRQRELCAENQREIYNSAMRDARDKSFLAQIAQNIQLLHGRGWIVSTFTAEGEKLQDSMLQHIGTSFRVSRLSEVEGHTLETRLSELRRIRWEERV